MVKSLIARGHDVTVHDPHADPDEAMHEYGLSLDAGALDRRYDLVLLAVAHREYRAMDSTALESLVTDNGMIADLKNALSGREQMPAVPLWRL
jgi:UDP-N-acetyl-D-galactosamine dehydrogenase